MYAIIVKLCTENYNSLLGDLNHTLLYCTTVRYLCYDYAC